MEPSAGFADNFDNSSPNRQVNSPPIELSECVYTYICSCTHRCARSHVCRQARFCSRCGTDFFACRCTHFYICRHACADCGPASPVYNAGVLSHIPLVALPSPIPVANVPLHAPTVASPSYMSAAAPRVPIPAISIAHSRKPTPAPYQPSQRL